MAGEDQAGGFKQAGHGAPFMGWAAGAARPSKTAPMLTTKP